MYITNKNYRCYYWSKGGAKRMGGYATIDTSDYSYDLQPGQRLNSIRYEGTNAEIYVHPTVLDVLETGVVITHLLNNAPSFIPWEKRLPAANVYEMRDMFIVPCEYLFENNKMPDILSGNIPTETYKDNEPVKCEGVGIWWQHGGFRKPHSVFAANLKNFIRSGQLSLDMEV